MNKLLLHIIGFSFFVCSCTEDNKEWKDTSDISVEVSIPFEVSEVERPATANMRAKDADTPFEVVYNTGDSHSAPRTTTSFSNLWVLQFNGETCVKAHYQASAATGNIICPQLQGGTNQLLYIIANGPAAGTFTTGITKTQFETLSYFDASGINNENALPYIGQLTECTITSDGRFTSGKTPNPIVSLKRIFSEISLSLDYSVAEYKIESVTMENVPRMMYIAGETLETNGKQANVIPEYPDKGIYKWYIGKNTQGMNEAIKSPLQKDFEHTPGGSYDCTYLRICTHKIDTNEKLTYYIYPGKNSTTDFNIETNHIYTINATIQGNAPDVEALQGLDGRVRIATSNCYIVKPGSSITILTDIKGNLNRPRIALDKELTTNLGVSPTHTAQSVKVVWQTSPGLITGISSIVNGRATISTASVTGNAVVAAYSGTTVLWSWHIWVTNYLGEEAYTTNNGIRDYTFMDRNLGATSNAVNDLGTVGLVYQWGRKDPFTGLYSWIIKAGATDQWYEEKDVYDENNAAIQMKQEIRTASQNLSNTIANPFVFYGGNTTLLDWYGDTPNNSLWGNPDIQSISHKTLYDPCPTGWKVSPLENGKSFLEEYLPVNGGSITLNRGSFSDGWVSDKIGYFPTSGFRNTSTGTLYLTSSRHLYLYFAHPTSFVIYALDGVKYTGFNIGRSSRDYGMAIRCVKE